MCVARSWMMPRALRGDSCPHQLYELSFTRTKKNVLHGTSVRFASPARMLPFRIRDGSIISAVYLWSHVFFGPQTCGTTFPISYSTDDTLGGLEIHFSETCIMYQWQVATVALFGIGTMQPLSLESFPCRLCMYHTMKLRCTFAYIVHKTGIAH